MFAEPGADRVGVRRSRGASVSWGGVREERAGGYGKGSRRAGEMPFGLPRQEAERGKMAGTPERRL